MNYIDIIIAIPLLIALYKGWTKGFIVGIATLTALVLGIFLAVNYSDYAKDLLGNKLDVSSSYIGYIAFILTFIAVVVIVNILGRVLSKIVEAMALGLVNRILGVLFTMAKYLIIISIFITLFERLDSNNKLIKVNSKQESKLYYPIYKISHLLYEGLHIGDLTESIKTTTDKF